LWLCSFENAPSTYASGSREVDAVAQCLEAGLGQPTALSYAGYAAEPGQPLELPLGPPPPDFQPTPRPEPKSTRRAELILTLYTALRCDFPIRSILTPSDAASRLPSASALRDFLANVGAAIERLRRDPELINRAIAAQAAAWIAGANEKNHRDRGKWKAAEVEAERKLRHRQNARRLRKRKDYRLAISELALVLDGFFPGADSAAESFKVQLIAEGFALDDAESLANRFRRISSPKI
jgi:hypothetical protein